MKDVNKLLIIILIMAVWSISMGIGMHKFFNMPIDHRQYIDLPEEMPIGSVGDLLVIEKNDKDTLRIGYWHPHDTMTVLVREIIKD